MKNKSGLNYAIAIAIVIVGVFSGLALYKKLTNTEPEIQISHQAIVQEMQTMGKMQLLTLQIKDIIDYTVTRRFLPDSKVMLQVSGEVNACIDFQKIKPEDVHISDQGIKVYLPLPEICYSKVDHENSRIFDKQSWILLDDDAALIESTYKEAERFMKSEEVTRRAIEGAIEKAPEILEPIIRRISGKENVEIHFRKTPLIG